MTDGCNLAEVTQLSALRDCHALMFKDTSSPVNGTYRSESLCLLVQLQTLIVLQVFVCVCGCGCGCVCVYLGLRVYEVQWFSHLYIVRYQLSLQDSFRGSSIQFQLCLHKTTQFCSTTFLNGLLWGFPLLMVTCCHSHYLI